MDFIKFYENLIQFQKLFIAYSFRVDFILCSQHSILISQHFIKKRFNNIQTKIKIYFYTGTNKLIHVQDKKTRKNTKIDHIIIHGNVSILLRYNEQLIEAISFNRLKLGALHSSFIK